MFLNKSRLRNPKEGANFFSLITFAFTFSTFRKGRKRDFQDEDVYEILDDFKSNHWGRRLQKAWDQQLKRNKSFLRALFQVYGFEFILIGMSYFFCSTIPAIIQPILVGKVVGYFDPHKTDYTLSQAYLYLSVLISLMIFRVFYNHTYNFAINQLSLKVRIGCCALIYRKSLKLNSHSLSKDANGRIITLITKDVLALFNAMNLFHEVWSAIVKALLMVYVMYNAIGVSAVIGFCVMIFVTPIQLFLGKLAMRYRAKTTKETDHRVRLTQEILTSIKIIKMYTWDWFFKKSVEIYRRDEIRYLRSVFYTLCASSVIGGSGSKLSFFVCVMTYVSLGNHISAENSFLIIGCFSTLGLFFSILLPIEIGHMAKSKVFIDRIKEFLLLDEIEPLPNLSTNQLGIKTKEVHLKGDGVEVLKNINLVLDQGLTVLTGDVGSGKSTLLGLFVGNQKATSGTIDISGKISFSTQEPWIFPGTIRENIVFSSAFDKTRYERVIECCALKQDLVSFPSGDQHCVIDQGLNLSGGQRARVNLARAVYRQADIYILDDCFSSLDAFVSRQIFDNCIRNFLAQKVRIITTHIVDYMKVADKIVIMNQGQIDFVGPFADLEQWKPNYADIIGKSADDTFQTPDLQVTNYEIRDKDVDNSKGMYDEEQKIGKVEGYVYGKYISFGGGYKPLFAILLLFALSQTSVTFWDYFVSFWVNSEQKITDYILRNETNTKEYKDLLEERTTSLWKYSSLILIVAFFAMTKLILYVRFVTTVSKNLHTKMIEKVIDAKMIFFDTHLSGNVLNRFSRDLCITDEYLPTVLLELIECMCIAVGVLATAAIANPWLMVPACIFVICVYYARQYYIPVGRSMMRLDGSTRGPLIGHINSSLNGLVTIQANDAQTKEINDFDLRHDHYNSAFYMVLMTVRAFGFYVNLICVFYITAIVLSFYVLKTSTLVGRIGVAIYQAFGVIELIQWAVKQWSELENSMTATERSLAYTFTPTEDSQGFCSRKEPTYGKVEFSRVQLQYPISDRIVLNNLSFVVEAGEKIGVVGRTGAGKSSIISVLFKLYDFSGTVFIDDVDTRNMNTRIMRSKISIIPQDPVIFSGTIRTNIDCNNRFSDDLIWKIIDQVHIRGLVRNLDEDISEILPNFSMGQKQLICLARAIINENPILVVDEATANVDPQTDTLIRDVIKSHFSNRTVITIAHRLNTIIDCDKVLVLNDGEMIQYDHPQVLIEMRQGLFYSMAQKSGLVN